MADSEKSKVITGNELLFCIPSSYEVRIIPYWESASTLRPNPEESSLARPMHPESITNGTIRANEESVADTDLGLPMDGRKRNSRLM